MDTLDKIMQQGWMVQMYRSDDKWYYVTFSHPVFGEIDGNDATLQGAIKDAVERFSKGA